MQSPYNFYHISNTINSFSASTSGISTFSQSSSQSPFLMLPAELISKILTKLDPKSWMTCAFTCKEIYEYTASFDLSSKVVMPLLLDKAKAALEIESSSEKRTALLVAIAEVERHTDSASALQTLQEAKKIALDIEDSSTTCTALLEIAEVERYIDSASATQTLQEAKRAVKEMDLGDDEDFEGRSTQFEKIVEVERYIDINAAKETAKQLISPIVSKKRYSKALLKIADIERDRDLNGSRQTLLLAKKNAAHCSDVLFMISEVEKYIDREEANRTFLSAKQSLDSKKDLEIFDLCKIANFQRHYDIEEAKLTLKTAKNKLLIIEEEGDDIIVSIRQFHLSAVIEVEKYIDINSAQRIANQMESGSMRNEALLEIIDIARHDDSNSAKNIAEQITDPAMQIHALIKCAEVERKTNIDCANKTLQKALLFSMEITDPLIRIEALLQIYSFFLPGQIHLKIRRAFFSVLLKATA